MLGLLCVVLCKGNDRFCDNFMDQIKVQTTEQFPNSLVAWEGLEIGISTLAVAGSSSLGSISTAGSKLTVETQISA